MAIQFGADFMPCKKPQQLNITSQADSCKSTSEFLNITTSSNVTEIPVATTSGTQYLSVHVILFIA